MTTIVTRAGKGAPLTFSEGDANFVNLNTDKIESISEDTNPSLGGSLDVNGYSITSSSNNLPISATLGNTVVIQDIPFPEPTQPTMFTSGSVTNVDDVRIPNTITLDYGSGIPMGNKVQFTGSDVSASGLTENFDYYIIADTGGGAYEISDSNNGAPSSFTDPGTYSDFNYTVFNNDGGVNALTDDVLYWDGSRLAFGSVGGIELTDISAIQNAAAGPGALFYDNTTGTITYTPPDLSAYLTGLADDTSPTLTANLDGAGFSVQDVQLENYKESVYTLAYASNILPDVANGNVQKITLSGNITFDAFTNPEAGQSMTLIVQQDPTGGRTLSSTMLFAGGDKDLTPDANAVDIISVFYDGASYYGSIAKGFA